MATQTEPIRGKIAKILGVREVALNIGKEQGVEPGMLFSILSPKGQDILDPDTGALLGQVDLPKVRVKIVNVYDKVSVAATYKTKRVNVGGVAGPDFRKLFQPPQWETRYETLKIKRVEGEAEELEDADSYVATGDPVVQVLDVAE